MVTADDKTRMHGDANPAFTASYAGFIGGETLATSGVTGNPTFACIATATSEQAMTRSVDGRGMVYSDALLVAVSAQAASFLASLLAAARRQQHTRLEVYLYQMVGLVTAGLVWWLLRMADPVAIAGARPWIVWNPNVFM